MEEQFESLEIRTPLDRENDLLKHFEGDRKTVADTFRSASDFLYNKYKENKQ